MFRREKIGYTLKNLRKYYLTILRKTLILNDLRSENLMLS